MNDLHIYMIIDGSGSMGQVKHDVVKGVNELIDDQKDEKQFSGDDIKFSLTVFDDQVSKIYMAEDIDLVGHVKVKDTFLGGSTALLDAIGKTLAEAEQDDSDKKLVAIYTDGGENASKEYKRDEIKKLIEDLQAKGEWQIIYMSAELADFSDARSIGIAAGNSLLGTTRAATAGTFSNISKSSSMYRTTAGGQTQDFFVATADAGDWQNTGGTIATDLDPGTSKVMTKPAPPEPKTKLPSMKRGKKS